MNTFLVDIELPAVLTQDFISLIPAQRKMVDELLLNRRILSYSLALDRSRLWVVFRAKDEHEVWNMIEEFPLIDYIEPEIHLLAFHNATEMVMPPVSMN